MLRRLLLGTLLGGVLAFAWSSVSHLVLPLGEAGVRTLPHEAVVLDALRTNIKQPGLYIFPGDGFGDGATPAQRQAWEQRYRTGPAGILVFRPVGGIPLSPMQLLVELGADLLCAGIGAWAVCRTEAFWRRLLVVTLLGLFAWLSIDVSYWNWYGFPTPYLLASLVDQVGGFLLAGLAIAWIVRPPTLTRAQRAERAARATADA